LFFEHFVVGTVEVLLHVFVSVVLLAAAVAVSFSVKSFVGFALAAVVVAFVQFVALVFALPGLARFVLAELARFAGSAFAVQPGHFAESVVVVHDLQLPVAFAGAVASAVVVATVGYGPRQ
jgi:hypothetical protein